MNKIILALSVTLLSIVCVFGQNDGRNLFDDSFLHEIRFENADTNVFIRTKNYQQSKLTIDGKKVDSIGFARKGNISGYTTTNKFPIKVKTNKYIAGKEYDGIREFTLHMNYQDPTMMREKLTYDICREMGLYSLRTAFAKVYINNVYWGLYTIVEGKDEMFKQVFGSRDMDAVESLDFGKMCYISGNPNAYNIATNGGNPTYQYANGNPSTIWTRFSTMIDKANNTPNSSYLSTVSNYLNLKDFFKYQAVNVYLMNFDSYIGYYGNQIYAYDTVANIWQVVPWDFNASFGLWNTNNYQPASYPMIPSAIANGCIASKLNSIPQLKAYYSDAMCLLTNSVGDTTKYFSKIEKWKNQIKEAVYSDTRKVITNNDFDKGIGYGYHSLFGDNQPALKTFLTARLAVVKQGLINATYNCVRTSVADNKNNTESFSVFPNPSNEIINIGIKETAFSQNKYRYEISNIMGQIILSNQVNNPTQAIDISKLSQGHYFITLKSKEGQATKIFIKI